MTLLASLVLKAGVPSRAGGAIVVINLSVDIVFTVVVSTVTTIVNFLIQLTLGGILARSTSIVI